MKTTIAIFFILMFSCNGTTQDTAYVCTCEQRKSVQEFVSNNIKNANNMSDEEMEDVIHELFMTGVKLNCELRIIERQAYSPGMRLTKLDSCEFYMF